MARLRALRREEVPELEPVFEQVEQRMGFVPNSQLTMARRPEIVRALGALSRAVRSGTLDPQLVELVALVSSTAAGCRYCQAHTASNSVRSGSFAAKVADVWSYETSELFSEAERAALRVAHHAGLVPNEVTDEEFAQLAAHFDDGQVVEIVATISLYGFLNRWNDTLATELEDHPMELAGELLADVGWEAGKHAADAQPAGAHPQSAAGSGAVDA